MAVDLTKMKLQKQVHEHQVQTQAKIRAEEQFANARVLDEVTLQKTWAKKPGYWIALIWDEKRGVYAIRKKWSYWSRQESKQIEDENIGSRTSSLNSISERYIDAINSKLTTEYKMVGRACSPESPALDHEFIMETPDSDISVEPEAQQPEKELKRKASYDVW